MQERHLETKQAKALTEYMLNGYKATRLTAAHQLGIANLTAVVSDIRKEGIEVVMLRKRDSHDRPYAEYKITDEQRRRLLETGKAFRDINHDIKVIM